MASPMPARIRFLLVPLLAITFFHASRGQSLQLNNPTAAQKGKAQRTDLYGDPLPEGALARLGTIRFREGPITRAVAFAPDGKTLASGGRGGFGLCLWNVTSGRALYRLRNSESVA